MPSFNPAQDIPDLAGKVIFVTGGTAGIGRAVVKALAAHSPAHIYFTGRNSKAGSEVVIEAKAHDSKCQITFIECDHSGPHHILREAILDKFSSPRLDVFIANAGILGVPPALTSDGYEVQWGTNFVAHAVMLKTMRRLMLATVKNSGDVRLVVVSSVMHMLHPRGGIEFEQLKTANAANPMVLYGQSKLAQILFVKSMAKRYPSITSVSVHPGVVQTKIHQGSAWRPGRILPWLCSFFFQTPEKASCNVLWATSTAKQNLGNGLYYEPAGWFSNEQGVGQKPGRLIAWWGMSTICNDEKLADKLWEWTEKKLKEVEEM